MVLAAGSLVGIICGVAHALYVYRVMAVSAKREDRTGRSDPAIYALWTLGLWIVFGTYVLVLWVIGLVFYLVFKGFRR